MPNMLGVWCDNLNCLFHDDDQCGHSGPLHVNTAGICISQEFGEDK